MSSFANYDNGPYDVSKERPTNHSRYSTSEIPTSNNGKNMKKKKQKKKPHPPRLPPQDKKGKASKARAAVQKFRDRKRKQVTVMQQQKQRIIKPNQKKESNNNSTNFSNNNNNNNNNMDKPVIRRVIKLPSEQNSIIKTNKTSLNDSEHLVKSRYIYFSSLSKKTRWGKWHDRFFVINAEEPTKLCWFKSYASFVGKKGKDPKNSMEILRYTETSSSTLPLSFSVSSVKKKIDLKARARDTFEQWIKAIASAIHIAKENPEASLQRALSEDIGKDSSFDENSNKQEVEYALSKQESIEIGYEVYNRDISNFNGGDYINYNNNNNNSSNDRNNNFAPSLKRETSDIGKNILRRVLSIDNDDDEFEDSDDFYDEFEAINVGRKDTYGDDDDDDHYDGIMNAKNVATDILSRTASACNPKEMYDALNYAINAIKAADLSNQVTSTKVINTSSGSTLRKILSSKNFIRVIQIQKLNRNWNNDTNEKYQLLRNLIEKADMLRNFASEFHDTTTNDLYYDNDGKYNDDDDDWFEQGR